jgi:hypothetical protein
MGVRFGRKEAKCFLLKPTVTLKTEGRRFSSVLEAATDRRVSTRPWRFFAVSSSARCSSGRLRRALVANDPPASADHLDDDEWHAAQDMWLVKWSGSVLFDGLLQYGCSVLGSAPMVAAERQCRARQAGTAAEQHARRAADSLASKGRLKVLRAQPQHCRADAEAAVESTDQARKVFNGLFWMALFFLITHQLAALLWFRWPAWRCNSCTVSDPAL